MFAHLSFLIPVNRLYETGTLIAFLHPQPSYPLHILIVPKREIPGLASIQSDDQDFLRDLFECVGALARRLGLEKQGYRLIANGGRYQDMPQLHFHLINEDPAAKPDQAQSP